MPAQTVKAGAFVPAARFPAVSDIPRWSDITPRFGIAYDLFADGKTALKFSVNKYVAGAGTRLTQDMNPVNTTVVSATRNWTDNGAGGGIAGDFIPQCDFSNPAAIGECGVISNTNFGLNNPRALTYDPNLLTGWGKRDYNWETTVSVERQLRAGLSINVGYFRRWYGNQTVRDNTLVVPANYSQYCVTLPADPRLPGGGGAPLCGFYDVVRRDDKRLARVLDVLVRDGRQPLLARGDFVHAALLVKAFDGAVHISARALFNDCLQLPIALSHDLVKVTVEAAEESDAFALGDTHVDCFLDERHFER